MKMKLSLIATVLCTVAITSLLVSVALFPYSIGTTQVFLIAVNGLFLWYQLYSSRQNGI